MTYNIEPARKVAALTKADDTVISVPEKGLWVGTAGTANIVDAAGNTHANFPLLQGYNPIRISQLESGGTASDIWGLY